ncbi:ABC transporter permease [Rhizohabitans arisaemae]|uniref:ABC transporter permease n=1 Tax=Rhizohabitans arisaemae TaxID=2720610 RepID=UPI0024B180E3|nr:ABC transporter permease [Rhizohabitans arisaemae]
MTDLLAAEWLKLRTLRSTFVVLAVVAAILAAGLLLAWYMTGVWDGLTAEQRARSGMSPPAYLVSWVGSLALGVLGVLTITSEYASGMIRASVAAVPARGRLIAAKAAVAAAVALAAGLVALFAAHHLSEVIVGGRPIPGLVTQGSQVLPLLATGLSMAVFALLGLGLGVLTRSAAGSIAIVVALWHPLPIIVANLPEPWSEWLGSLMIAALPGQIAGTGNENSIFGDRLPPPIALVALLAYAAVPLALAAFTITRRDA